MSAIFAAIIYRIVSFVNKNPMYLTQVMAKGRSLFAFLLFSLAIVSCKKDTQVTQSAAVISAPKTQIDSLRSSLHDIYGIALEKIVFDSARQVFILNHTGLVTLENAKLNLALSKSQNINTQGARGLRSGGSYVTPDTVKNVRVYINPDRALLPQSWATAAQEAVAAWNNTDCLINMTAVTDPSLATILITTFNTPVASSSSSYMKEVAQGAFPIYTNGVLGRTVSINLAYTTIISQSAMKQAIVHALGHCFNFTNNDDTGTFTLITEVVPPANSLSVFETLSHDWAGFDFYDYITVSRVYPRPTMLGTTKKIHLLRYFNASWLDHSYVTDITTYGPSTDGYIFEKGDGYLRQANNEGLNLVAVYRYEQTGAHDNLLTTDPYEFENSHLGYIYRGIIGYAAATQLPGTKPLYRYWSDGAKDHLYTTDFAELNGASGKIGYAYEEITCYVW